MPTVAQTKSTMNSGRIDFPKDHQRITPRNIDELMALEPEEIAQMIFAIRNTSWLYGQIKSKSWKQIVRKVDKFNLKEPGMYIPSNLLSQWVDFLSRVLMWREDAHEVATSNSLAHEKRDREKLIHKLTKTVAFGLYMQRVQVVKRFSQTGRSSGDLLNPDKVSVDELLDAWRWCQAYATVLENPKLNSYCNSMQITPDSIASLSYLQLTQLIEAIDDFANKQRLVREVHRRFPSYLDLLGGTSQYTHLYTTPLQQLSHIQLSSLLKELDAMAEAKISYDDDGGIIALS